MKNYLFALLLFAIIGCSKKEAQEIKPTIEPMTAYEQSFVGKWNFVKTENRNSSGALISTTYESSSTGYPYESAFIDLQASNYGGESHKYIERYGNGTSPGSVTSWSVNGNVMSFYSFPSYVPTCYVKTISVNSLVIRENENNTGFTIYYSK